jgi:hypothetical protein
MPLMLERLAWLEAESIYLLREAAAERIPNYSEFYDNLALSEKTWDPGGDCFFWRLGAA